MDWEQGQGNLSVMDAQVLVPAPPQTWDQPAEKWLHRAAIKSTLDPNKPGGNLTMGNLTTGNLTMGNLTMGTHSIHTSS